MRPLCLSNENPSKSIKTISKLFQILWNLTRMDHTFKALETFSEGFWGTFVGTLRGDLIGGFTSNTWLWFSWESHKDSPGFLAGLQELKCGAHPVQLNKWETARTKPPCPPSPGAMPAIIWLITYTFHASYDLAYNLYLRCSGLYLPCQL